MIHVRQYIKIEIRNFMSTMPGFLLSLLTTLLLAALLYVSVRGLLPKALEVKPFRIGLCIEGEAEQNLISVYISSAMEQMESTKNLVEFEEISFQELKENQESRKLEELLEEREFTACIVIPERTVESIMEGTNIPVRVVMGGGGDNAERYLQKRLLMLLAECGAAYIDVAQAETLLLYEMQVENPEELGKILDLFHFGLVMGREDWFERQNVSAFGNAGFGDYYLAAGLTFLLLFWGLGCGGVFETGHDSLPLLLERRGISPCIQQGVRQGLFILWHLVPAAGAFLVEYAAKNGGGSMLLCICGGMLCAAALSLQSSFFFTLAPTAAGGVMLNAVFGLVCFFGAGGVLPTVFLPDAAVKVCNVLPVGICMQLLRQGMGAVRYAGGGGIGLCLLWCLFFAAAGQLVFYQKQRKYR